jgi:serine/threonine-protein kinase
MQLGLDGTLLYLKGGETVRENGEVVWVDRRGRVELVDPEWGPIRVAGGAGVTLSPDGSRLALGITDVGGATDGEIHMWIKQLDRGPLTRLTFDGSVNDRAQWTPDGTALRFISDRGGDEDVWHKRADGSAQAELVLDLEEEIWELVHSSDGNLAVVRTGGLTGDRDLHLVGSGDSSSVTLLSGSFDEMSPTLSPDGRLMAYVSDESGRREVYVRPFPDAGASRWPVSKNGGTEPLWSHSGTELFYVNSDGEMIAAQVTTDPTFRIDGEEVLFSMGTDYHREAVNRYYDVSADDQRFVMIRWVRASDQSDMPDLILAENWLVELEELVGDK